MNREARRVSVLRRMLEVGKSVQFVKETGDYDDTTDTPSNPVDITVDGTAIEISGDFTEYERMNLIKQDPVTLLFIPDTDREEPAAESGILWEGRQFKVRKVRTLALGAKVILV